MSTKYEIVARLLKENIITVEEAALLLEKEIIYQYFPQPQPIQIQPYVPQYPLPYVFCQEGTGNVSFTTSNSGTLKSN